MALAAFAVVPRDEQEFQQWSFAHAAHHSDINRVIFQNYGVRVSGFILDPFDRKQVDGWLWQHQQMHAEMDAVLRIQGNILTTVDWEDAEALQSWVSDNASEHYQAGQILGLG